LFNARLTEELFREEIQHEHTRRAFDGALAERLFSLEEKEKNEEKTRLAMEALKSNKLESPSAATYHEALGRSQHAEMLSPYSVSEFAKMKLFMIPGMAIGFALKKFPETGDFEEVVAVFNNEPGVAGIGEMLMEAAVRNGACFLDHFGTPTLNRIYSLVGFEAYNQESFDPKYVSGDFTQRYGKPNVIYRVHKNCKHKLQALRRGTS
jgi:hypothetical protein